MKQAISVFFGAIAAVLISSHLSPAEKTVPNHSVFERVLSSRTLRCGYALWPLYIERDPNTGKLSGAYHDFIDTLGKRMGLTVEWTQEIPFGDTFEALNAGRVDAVCSGIWPDELRALRGEFTNPIAYQGVFAFARANDTRFDSPKPEFNSPDIGIATVDGEMSQHIKLRVAPDAREYSIPKDADIAQALLAVSAKKADITFTDAGSGALFSKTHPNVLKIVSSMPLSAHGMTTALKKGEFELQSALNVATSALLLSGEVDKILDRYDPEQKYFERVRKPYL